MKAFLKSHWPGIAHVLAAIVILAAPSVRAWLASNVKYAAVGGLIWAEIMRWAQSPSNGGGGLPPIPNMRSGIVGILVLFFLVPQLHAQNSPLPTVPFSFTANAVALPGGLNSFMGTDAGVSVQPSEYVAFSEHNVISSDNRLQFFGGGIEYFFPALSLGVNNMTPTMSGFRLLFSIGGTFGDARVTLPSGTVSHWGEDFHGSVSYALTSTGSWQLGVRAGAARYPYYAKSAWVPVIEAGPAFHF